METCIRVEKCFSEEVGNGMYKGCEKLSATVGGKREGAKNHLPASLNAPVICLNNNLNTHRPLIVQILKDGAKNE